MPSKRKQSETRPSGSVCAADNAQRSLTVASRKREFTVVIEKGDDYFFAYVPELQVCQTQAKTMNKLMPRIKEAIELCLEVEQMDDELVR